MFILYPTIGFLTTLSSIGYLIYAIKDQNQKQKRVLKPEKRDNHQTSQENIEIEEQRKFKKEKMYRTLVVITLLSIGTC